MKKKFKISLQFSMLSIFLTLFICTVLTIIIVSTIRLYDSMVVISDQQMQQATVMVQDKLKAHLMPAELSSEITQEMIQANILNIKDSDEVLNYTIELLSKLSNAAMVYWGDADGNFIISRLESNRTLSSEIIKRDGKSAVSTHLSRNAQQKLINTTQTEGVTYDPRQRPWYKAAKNAHKTTWSNAYIFFTGEKKTLGVTLGTPIYDVNNQLRGVFGIDMKLDAISKFLAQQTVGKTGVAFIIDKEGKLIAHPQLSALTDQSEGYHILPVDAMKVSYLAKAFKTFQKLNANKFSFADNGRTYLTSFHPIPSFKQHEWYIAVVIPEDDFVGVLKQTTKLTMTLSGFIILFGILLITVFSRQISKQMKHLVHQTYKIKNFNLTPSADIHSCIKEVSILAGGIKSMRSGLRSFQKYVPADLVRQLIERHESAKLGGDKKKIAIIFTDIQDFTTISESLPAEALMKHLCDYFDYLSSIINEQKGTIDKYIGDAIMAFWGSPVADDRQAYHACNAAIQIQNTLKTLNARWTTENKPAMPTRIGIHLGDAIVGNLGSSERLNYTAIGDTINIASRLETINKVYGTNVIVSTDVQKEVANDFIFKELDCIMVKGKKESTLIYELIAKKGSGNDEAIEAQCERYKKALQLYRQQQWDQAIEAYQAILKSMPNDRIPKVFIQRCKLLKESPPSKDWDGVWIYLTKSGKKEDI